MRARRLSASIGTASSVVFALTMLGLAPASAQDRVVVERFTGPEAPRLRALLIESLEESGFTVVPESDAADAAGGFLRAQADYAQAARQLSLSGFVDGRTARRGRSWTLTVRVRAPDGSIAGSDGWSGSTLNALNAVRRNGAARVRRRLGSATPAPPTVEAENGQLTEGAAESTEPPWYAAGATEPEAPTDAAPASDAPAVERYDVLRLQLQGGTLRRSFSTIVSAPIDAAGNREMQQRSYTSAGLGAGELGVRAEFFPGAFGASQPFPYLGVVASFRHSIALSATGCRVPFDAGTPCDPADVVNLGARTWEFFALLRGRYRFGDERRAPGLSLDIGGGALAFELDVQGLMALNPGSVVPPMTYSYVHLGAGFDYGIVPVYLTLAIEAAYRVGVGIGADAQRIWGVGSGMQAAFTLGAELRSEAPYITDGVYFAVGVQYMKYVTKFAGDTVCLSGNCTMDATMTWPLVTVPSPVDDDYLRLSLAIGYALR